LYLCVYLHVSTIDLVALNVIASLDTPVKHS